MASAKIEERDSLVDAAIRHADAVLTLKRRRREFAELQERATAFRHQVLAPAEAHVIEARNALDAVVEPVPAEAAA